MLLDIIIMDKKRKGIIVKDLRKLEEILSGNNSIKYKRIELNNKNILRMRIETISHNNNKSEAQTLEEIKKKIRESEHRVNYYITVCYDGSAEYYCNKLMIPLAIFERNLRQFLYLILISLYDIEWHERFISKEVIEDIKKKKKKKKKKNNDINELVEKGLEYLTFQDYIKCLFTPKNLKSMEEIIEEVNNENEKEGVTKEDIVNIINNNREKTMWEVICNDIKIEFSREDIDNIRKIRNEVVHNKEMTSQEYESNKKIINESNKKIKMVITKIEEEKYREKIFDIRPILDMYLNQFKKISDIISNAFKTNIELEKITQSVTVMSNIVEQNKKRFENQMKPILTQADIISNIFKTNIELEKITQSVTVMSNIIEQDNKRFENIIKPIRILANTINQSKINQSLDLKNFNTVYKDENREENNKEN